MKFGDISQIKMVSLLGQMNVVTMIMIIRMMLKLTRTNTYSHLQSLAKNMCVQRFEKRRYSLEAVRDG